MASTYVQYLHRYFESGAESQADDPPIRSKRTDAGHRLLCPSEPRGAGGARQDLVVPLDRKAGLLQLAAHLRAAMGVRFPSSKE